MGHIYMIKENMELTLEVSRCTQRGGTRTTETRINSYIQSLIQTSQGKTRQGRHTGTPGVTSRP